MPPPTLPSPGSSPPPLLPAVALHSHSATIVLFTFSLASSWPQTAVLPSITNTAHMGAIITTSLAPHASLLHPTNPTSPPPSPSPHPVPVVALYFHSATIVLSTFPLAASWPQRAVLPSLSDAALLVVIAATSFAGQLLLTRGFQLESASRAASINFSQVGGEGWGWGFGGGGGGGWSGDGGSVEDKGDGGAGGGDGDHHHVTFCR